MWLQINIIKDDYNSSCLYKIFLYLRQNLGTNAIYCANIVMCVWFCSINWHALILIMIFDKFKFSYTVLSIAYEFVYDYFKTARLYFVGVNLFVLVSSLISFVFY